MIDFKNMKYVEFISFIEEVNRCPGGKNTINWILKNSFANNSTKAIEIGSNTGFSSLEVARTVKCSILGIEPVVEAVRVANKELSRDTQEIQNLVTFKVGSAYKIPCDDDKIDLIIAGGSTSFMNDRDTAVKEMWRVLKPWGFLSVTNLYYHTEPPKELLASVSKIIGVDIKAMNSSEWVDIYTSGGDFELYKLECTSLSSRSPQEIKEYIEYFMEKPHINSLSAKEKGELRDKWLQILLVFNENHKYLGFNKAILRKRYVNEEPELFKL